MTLLKLAYPLLIASATLCAAAPAPEAAPHFESTIKPFLKEYCVKCHNPKKFAGDVDLEAFLARPAEQALAERKTWSVVSKKLKEGEMPPAEEDQPGDAEIAGVVHWLEGQFAIQDRTAKPNAGSVAVRRLNRQEYNNTIRDLLGVNFRFSEDFPTDQFGNGFNNVSAVQTLSAILMEKYFQTADRVSRVAIPPDKPYPRLAARYEAEATGQQSRRRIQAIHNFPVDGTYTLRTAWEQGVPGVITLVIRTYVDGKEVFNLTTEHTAPLDRAREARDIFITQGTHKVETDIEFIPHPGKKEAYPYPVRIQIDGPFETRPREQSLSYRRIFQGDGTLQHGKSARTILAPIVRRAYRRPIKRSDLNPFVALAEATQKQGGAFEDGIRVALQAVLISPDFLFRVERDPAGYDAHRVSDVELASRLSYFLWSSMPDDELLLLAEKGKLHTPDVLHAQVRRMLADPKAHNLAEDFSGQWLQTRNLELARPDRTLFPDYDLELRDCMLTETQMFFQNVVDEDLSILDFLDGRFTFLNERLARHYGIPGVTGREFRRVELSGPERSGIMTQASVLTVSSYPTRTSPVLRGKWVLENILNTPPPLPPPNVPALQDKNVGESVSLRHRLEEHRANPACASCHARMDPLGFALENYDAIGRWRTADGQVPVETNGRLSSGKAFANAEELKGIFRDEGSRFTKAFVAKSLTYALGRGLEYYDEPAVAAIIRRVEDNGYHFSEAIIGIVDSVPFQQRQRERPILPQSEPAR